MIRCEDTLDIARPPAEVFAYVDDPGHAATWLGQCIGLVQTSPPPRRVGTTLHYTYRQGSRPGEMDGVVTEYAPGRRLAMKFTDKMFGVVVAYRVEPAAAGATFTHSIEIEPSGFCAKLLSPLIRMGTRRQLRKDNAKLKELLSPA